MENIRTRLAEVTAQDVSLHETLLEELRATHNHSITSITTEEAELPEDFMCFEYALGLVYSDDYLNNREFEFRTSLHPIGANDEFMSFILGKDWLNEIDCSESQDGDMVIYFNEGKPCHAGVLYNQGRVRSKWGCGLLVEHEVFEVPSIYGEEVKYFRSAEIRLCEDAFFEYAESKGRRFTTGDESSEE